ncbi:DUF305 domain-containing protein [Nocardia abscessus]|uniref:DUF305 domain-containing protein n=1 Tax=Nocardia abscessus TaxID=120957 RepID=A0ABS0CFH3_9NOCA|nr:DUF305 domain-containing protein [Nocardia abscessus]MBF6228671.1 DUF305 domain-containing protein [Nocardia abscessus]
MFRRAAVIVAAATIALVGCGDGDDQDGTAGTTTLGETMPATTPQTPTDYNDADATFLQMMYPHHAQAVQMADLVPSRSQNQQVLDLAVAIKAAQELEMAQISTLLQQFGKPAPAANHGGMPGMPGMMSPESMGSLQSMSGSEFDRMWLSMMIEHHRGAIEMAQTELANGKNSEARKLAETVISTQQSEIDKMQRMLQQS